MSMNTMGFVDADGGGQDTSSYMDFGGGATSGGGEGGGLLVVPPLPTDGAMRWDEELPPGSELLAPAFNEDDDDDDDDFVVGGQQQHRVEGTRQQFDTMEDLEAGILAEEEAEHPYEKHELPEYACRYCRCHDKAAMARCNTCKKWFCNSQYGMSGSHIVTHLVTARHKEVSLHADSDFGDAPLECWVCGSKNIFGLGFVPSKQESVVIILCRDPCLNAKSLELEWDPASWLALIEDRTLLSWLTTKPRGAEMQRCRQLSKHQVIGLEEFWKKNPDGDLEEMQQEAPMLDLPEIPLTFQDGESYMFAFQSILEEEMSYQQQNKESQAHDNVQIQWETTVSGKKAIFSIPNQDHSGVGVGDEIRILHTADKYDTYGTITQVVAATNAAASDTFHVMVKSKSVPSSAGGYIIRLSWNPTGFTRMKTAMKTMAHEETSLSAYLFYKLLGQNPVEKPLKVEIPDDLSAPNLASLNQSQRNAVHACLAAPLALIQGPPGTGKTVTSASLIYHMTKVHRAQILVCAPSNVAVNQLAERVAKTGLNVIRLSSRSREVLESNIDHLMLHVQVQQFCENSPKHSDLRKLHVLKSEVGDLSPADFTKFKKLMMACESDLLAAADVICCTCSGAGDLRLSTFRFKHVLIDEATQAMEPEALIPIVSGAKQVILVGDHCQMGPVVQRARCGAAGLGRSLFERMIMLGTKPIRLDVQYRMHPVLSEFSSNHFYEGTLQNGVSAEERDASSVFPWPDPGNPTFFYNSIGAEEIGGSGTSYLNRTEAALAEKFLTYLLNHGVMPDDIGIITPYEGQRCFLVNYIQRNGTLNQEAYRRVEIASVDSFQGREKEFIILTCVRSSDHQGIGFLASWQRLNVALTRARRGVMLIGNARVLARNPLWSHLINHYKDMDLLVDGPLQNLKPIDVALPKPREVYNSKSIGPVTVAMYESDYLSTTSVHGGQDSGPEGQQHQQQMMPQGGGNQKLQLGMPGMPVPPVPDAMAYMNQLYAPGQAPYRHFETAQGQGVGPGKGGAAVAGGPASQASMSFDTQSQD